MTFQMSNIQTIESLLNFEPGVTNTDRIYDVLRKIKPVDTFEVVSLQIFIDTIIYFALNNEHYFKLSRIFGAMAYNVSLYPIYYQLDLKSVKRFKLDPQTEQIIDYFDSFIKNRQK